MNLTGQFLISMPSLQDERFEKTVIYMCAHSKDGAMGIIINKKIDYDLYPDLLEQLGIKAKDLSIVEKINKERAKGDQAHHRTISGFNAVEELRQELRPSELEMLLA